MLMTAPFSSNGPMVSANGAQPHNSLLEGLSVRLEAPNGKTDFMMGEPIVLRLVFQTIDLLSSQYHVNTTRMFGLSVTVNAYNGLNENFWPDTAAWYISPPFAIVKTAMPL